VDAVPASCSALSRFCEFGLDRTKVLHILVPAVERLSSGAWCALRMSRQSMTNGRSARCAMLHENELILHLHMSLLAVRPSSRKSLIRNRPTTSSTSSSSCS